MMSPICDLLDAADASPARVGGKAHALGKLARFGLRVPPGFAVTAPALADGLSSSLEASILAEIDRRGWQDMPLAVRSSAPQEDSAVASFAGIFRSELGIRGATDLMAAIGRVRASGDTPQAAAYRAQRGLADGGMAVLIMPLVAAQAAGVAFTCDPQSGRDDRIVIHAVPGLADQLVGGTQNGAEIVIEEDRQSEALRIVSSQAPDGQLSPLTADRALQLAQLLRDAAQALDYADPAFDLEWVFDGEAFWLVQARPVTARRWHTYPGLAGQEAIWSNGNTRDVVPHVMGAMDWIGWRRMVDLMLEQGYRLAGYRLLPGARRSALLHGRLYLNASFIQWEGYDAFGFAPSAMNALLGGHHPEIAVSQPALRDRVRRTASLLRFVARAGAMRRRGRAQAATAFADAARFRQETLASLGDDALAGRLTRLIDTTRTRDGLMFLQGSSGGNLYLLLELVGRRFPEERHALVAAIMAGGPPSITAQQAYDLQTLADVAGDEPAVRAFLAAPPPRDITALPAQSRFREAFAAFLDQYGHRGIYESYYARPRFAEDPDYLFDLIAAQLAIPREARARADAQRRDAADAAWNRLREALSPAKRWWARTLVGIARAEANDREMARSALTVYGAETRRTLLEIADRLLRRGALKHRNDIFDLTPHEALAALAGRLSAAGLQARVMWRQAQKATCEAESAPEVILGRRALPAVEAVRSASGSWRGVAVGAGLAEGVARLIESPDEGDRLKPGEILVAPSTDPAWTPLFLRAAGLVMETGGYLSHGAIVAREFGIPAVVNLPGIRAALRDGVRLRVDGVRGEVTPLD